MATIKLNAQLERAASDLVGTNNQFLAIRNSIKPILDRLAGLNAPKLAEVDAALTELGIDPVDFHALEESLNVVVEAVDGNLTFIQTKFS